MFYCGLVKKKVKGLCIKWCIPLWWVALGHAWPGLLGWCWWSLTINLTHQLRHKRGETSNLCTYAFIIDSIPHVFGDYCFVGLKIEYMGKYTTRRIPIRRNAKLRKGIIERPIYLDNLGAKQPKEQPRPSQESTMLRRW
jgi:hypothetical protein